MAIWRKKKFTVRLPQLSVNERFSKLTDNKTEVVKLNYPKIQNHGCVIYHGVCSSGAEYNYQNIRNSNIWWKKYSTGRDKNFDCVKHLNDKFSNCVKHLNNFSHEFWCFVLSRAPKNCLKQEIPEAYYIKTCQPSLNAQWTMMYWICIEMVWCRFLT